MLPAAGTGFHHRDVEIGGIGGSSSGKTLLVDSLYRQIVGEFDESIYLDTPYSIQDIQVINPAGQTPHYLPRRISV